MSIHTIKFACLCRKITGAIAFSSASTRPVAYLCHCFNCRHASGTLCSTKIVHEASHFAVTLLNGNLESFDASPDLKVFFCGHCGSSIYEKQGASERIAFNTGILEDLEGTVDFQSQCCSEQTGDGGFYKWLELPESTVCLMHPDAAASSHRAAMGPLKEPDILAFCLCNGVRLKITPPNEATSKASSPYSDLIRPFHSSSPENPNDEKWWLRANGTKYFAGTCACKSCRLASGNDVQAWAFIPKLNIRQLDDQPLDFSMATLKQYESSKGVYRNFCGSCGATVFWHDETRPELIDVAAGLLDAGSGARAEDLLEWATERVSFEEDAQNKDVVAKLSAGIRAWAEA